MTQDSFLTIGKSLVYHGPLNQRAYLMRLHQDDAAQMPATLLQLARDKGYGKIIAKIPQSLSEAFLQDGYEHEAELPFFYDGKEHAVFLAKYLAPERKISKDQNDMEHVLDLTREAQRANIQNKRTFTGEIQELKPEHASALAALYGSVFKAYPFPILDPAFVLECMEQGCRYFGIFEGDELIAASCAEVDAKAKAAELTDFATSPDHRRKGLAQVLLQHMIIQTRASGLKTLFTIARATSPGMNLAYAKSGFRYAGTLINNTHFDGGLESMNIWVNTLPETG